MMWAARTAWRSKYLDPQLIFWWALLSILLMGSISGLVVPLQVLISHKFTYFFPLFPVFLNYSSYSPFSNQPNNGLVPLLYPWVSGVASFLFPLTHVFPHLLESQGILTKSEDSLGTCSRRRLRLGSGFFSQSLDLGYQPYSDRI